VKAKTIYAIKKGLGGIMFWQFSGDKYENGLLDAIDDGIKAQEQAGH
jgi:GH18 family chitinase